MTRDILFKTDGFIFSYRVGGILIRGDKILLQRVPGDDFYAVIGGHVSAMETAAEALRREFCEELHAKIAAGDLLAVCENFFPGLDGKPCHQICLYYKVRLLDEHSIPLDGVFHGYDEFDNRRVDLDFCWVPLGDLESGSAVIYPRELVPHILAGSGKPAHFVSSQL